MDLVLVRVLFVALLAIVCYFLHPFGLTGWMGACAGAMASGAVIIFEVRVRALTLRRLIGAVAGSVLGIFGAALFCLVLRSVEGFSCEEIAEILKVPKGTVFSRLARARESFIEVYNRVARTHDVTIKPDDLDDKLGGKR